MTETGKTDTQSRVQEFEEDVSSLCDAFSDLPAYEVCYRTIAYSTKMLLHAAPNHLIAMKTILAAVEIGIAEYQKEKEKK